jgi:hypothetical protein
MHGHELHPSHRAAGTGSRASFALPVGTRRSTGPADGFRRRIAQGGGDATGTFSCSKASNEMNFLAQKLVRVGFGSHNVDSCNRT